jgi:hypothetical protein
VNNGLGTTIKYLVNQNAGVGGNLAKYHIQKYGQNSDKSPFSVAAFVVNSEPHIGARRSVGLCVGPDFSRCIHFEANNGEWAGS